MDAPAIPIILGDNDIPEAFMDPLNLPMHSGPIAESGAPFVVAGYPTQTKFAVNLQLGPQETSSQWALWANSSTLSFSMGLLGATPESQFVVPSTIFSSSSLALPTGSSAETFFTAAETSGDWGSPWEVCIDVLATFARTTVQQAHRVLHHKCPQ